jgi:GAF domain-containing protein
MAGAAILEGTIRRCLPPSVDRQEALAHVAAALAVSLELAKAREAVDVGG